MPNVLNCLENHLTARKQDHNDPALIDTIVSLGVSKLEWQINVSAGNGEPVAGKRNTYSDGLMSWWNIRIPHDADTNPKWRDYNLDWPVSEHYSAIGTTGWNWVEQCSQFLAFDFDSIAGHAAGVGMTPEQLAEVQRRGSELDWVEVRTSTGGGGLHFYVWLDSIPCENHSVHAALARAILGMMSTETGFDFSANVDACGGVIWIDSRRATKENGGFSLIKKATRVLKATDLPPNWRDNIEVVTRRRAKVKVSGVADADHGAFDQLALSRKRIPLDAKHKSIIQVLAESGFSTVWIPDYHLLQTHTCAFKKALGQNRESLNLVGIFDTNSPGSDPGSPNCFAFPLEHGAWKVCRFSPGCKEADTWEHSEKNWTTCYFNRQPSLAVACHAFGGIELSRNKGFEFAAAEGAVKAADAIGQKIELPGHLLSRRGVLCRNTDGRLICEIEKSEHDPAIAGWLNEKKKFVRVFQQQTDVEREFSTDEHVRALVSPMGDNAGIFVHSAAGTWDRHSASDAKMFIQSLGYKKSEAEIIIGQAVRCRWELVAIPFQSEYPGGRQWNKGAAQLKVQPALHHDQPHSHWDLILDHIGQSLTEPLQKLEWAQQSNIKTGGDYLRSILAAMIRDPFEPTPYLFLYGPENCGKSILWEACDLLFTGIVKADRALSSQNDFNGELAGAVMCVIEEKDISKASGALNRIKDYVTSRTLSIRRMRTDTYQIPNTTHWFQFSNDPTACPVFPGDTRITSIDVPPLRQGTEVPKAELLEKLGLEAPAFLRTLLDLTLPVRTGRMRIPIVETEAKELLAEDNAPLLAFIRQCCELKPDAETVKQEVFNRYCLWATDQGESPIGDSEFFRQMRRAAPQLKSARSRSVARKHVYRGLQLVQDVQGGLV
jgi:Family of unknown function (DUF5906)